MGLRRQRRLALAFIALLCSPAPTAAAEPGSIRGSLHLDIDGLGLGDVAPVVVYLESRDGRTDFPLPGERPSVRQRAARFSPRFLAIAAGQSVDMANDDAIYHSVFSYSAPNDFDLGLYPSGESRTITFRHPGVVKTYCSIHESMNGVILVTPSPFFDTVSKSGRYELRGVPAGRYRVHTWSERLPASVREVELRGGEDLELDLVLGPMASDQLSENSAPRTDPASATGSAAAIRNP